MSSVINQKLTHFGAKSLENHDFQWSAAFGVIWVLTQYRKRSFENGMGSGDWLPRVHDYEYPPDRCWHYQTLFIMRNHAFSLKKLDFSLIFIGFGDLFGLKTNDIWVENQWSALISHLGSWLVTSAISHPVNQKYFPDPFLIRTPREPSI